jgi:hypothetical protein
MSASSERPRDRLGRPLPVGDPRSFPTVPDRAYIDGDEAWSQATSYLNDGLPFHAHEVFEQRWKCAPDDERDSWQALAQWGAALTHHARGNPVGCTRVAERAEERFRAELAAGRVPAVIDVAFVLESLSQLT